MKLDNTKAQMKKGVLEMCILSILSQKEAYPSDILIKLKEADLLVVEGTIYPLLNRLKKADLLSYRWEESNSGPPRKYYKTTALGKKAVSELQESWLQLVESVQKTIKK